MGTGRRAVVSGKPPFADVVCGHGATVLRVCRAVLGPVDADDAWSETFLAALRAYPALPADANLQAWLVTIAHRKAIDAVRRARRTASPVPDIPAGAADPDRAESDLDVAVLLARLSDRQRQAVAYHYLGGLPYAAVAEIIGGTPDAARRAAADGIGKLRRLHDARSRTGPTQTTATSSDSAGTAGGATRTTGTARTTRATSAASATGTASDSHGTRRGRR